MFRTPGYRRTRRTAAAVGAALALTFVATDPGAAAPQVPESPTQAAFNNGTGTAIAIGYKVNPVLGNLSFGITAGESVAGHQNTGATGQARAINLGVIGVTLAGEGCDGGSPTLPESQQPQPVIVSNSDEGSERGVTEKELELITKHARATDDPLAEAITEIAPTGDRALLYISGGRTIARSGVIDGSIREASARTEIAEITLLGGLVKLQGLTWEAIHRSGAEELTQGTFQLGALVIGGVPIDLPDDLFDQAEALNSLLTPLGIQIRAPKVHVEQGIVYVDPLAIAIIPSEVRDTLVGALLDALASTRDTLTQLLLETSCSTATAITIADLAVGTLSGAGQLSIELGGVQATTAEFTAFEFAPLPELPPVAPPAAPPAPSTGGASLPASPTPAFTPPAPTPQPTLDKPATPEAVTTTATTPIADLTGTRGGWMAVIAGGGLAALLATAEGDRRKMRRALREIPLEA